MSTTQEMQETYPATEVITPEHWRDLWYMLSAYNSSGVVLSFPEYMALVNQEANNRNCAGIPTGNDWRNRHPVVILFLEKLASLAGIGVHDVDASLNAVQICKERAGV